MIKQAGYFVFILSGFAGFFFGLLHYPVVFGTVLVAFFLVAIWKLAGTYVDD